MLWHEWNVRLQCFYNYHEVSVLQCELLVVCHQLYLQCALSRVEISSKRSSSVWLSSQCMWMVQGMHMPA